MFIEERLKVLGIELPDVKIPKNLPIESGAVVGDFIFMSGHTPTIDGQPQYIGRVGESIDFETAKAATRLATINCLSAMKNMIGDLDRVKRIVKLNGFVACIPQYSDQALVINEASELIVEIFNEKGHHARAALGVAALPGGVPVEIEIIAQIE